MRGGEPFPAPPAAAAARSERPSSSATRPVHPIAIVERLSSQAAVGIRRRPQASPNPVFGSRGRAIRHACIASVSGFERAVTVCKAREFPPSRGGGRASVKRSAKLARVRFGGAKALPVAIAEIGAFVGASACR